MTSTTPGDEEREPAEAAGTDPVEGAADAAGAGDSGAPDQAGSAEAAAAAPVDEAPAAAAPATEPVASDAEPAAEAASGEAGGAVETPAAEASELDATARLDAAVERAAAVGADEGEAEAPAPVPADSVRRETYVPAASVAAGAAAGAATLAPEPAVAPVAPAAPQAIYVQAPTAPRAKGNRAFGVLVALIGTALFAALYLGAGYLLLLTQGGSDAAAEQLVQFASKQVYWVPVAVFFLGFALLAAIVNRGRWWAYVVFGVLVAAAVYFSYVGGALWTVAWQITPSDVPGFVAQRWLDPFAIVAAVIAREIPIWLGGWIAARGRAVTERNRVAYEAYERELAAGPQPR